MIDERTAERVLRLVGLGARARGVVVGVDRVRDAAKAGKLAYAVVATDAARNSREKVVPLLSARRVRFVEVSSAAQLGTAVGRQQTAVVGIIDQQLAKGIRQLVEASSIEARQEGV